MMTLYNLELFEFCDNILTFCDILPIRYVKSDEIELGTKQRVYLDICLNQLMNDKYIEVNESYLCITPLGQAFIRTQGYVNKFIKESKYDEYTEQLRLSTLETNASVRNTNLDTQSNFKIQKWLTIASVFVSISALIVSSMTYFKNDDDENKTIRMLKEDNRLELKNLHKVLVSNSVDSVLNLTRKKRQ